MSTVRRTAPVFAPVRFVFWSPAPVLIYELQKAFGRLVTTKYVQKCLILHGQSRRDTGEVISHGISVDINQHLAFGNETVVDFYVDWRSPVQAGFANSGANGDK